MLEELRNAKYQLAQYLHNLKKADSDEDHTFDAPVLFDGNDSEIDFSTIAILGDSAIELTLVKGRAGVKCSVLRGPIRSVYKPWEISEGVLDLTDLDIKSEDDAFPLGEVGGAWKRGGHAIIADAAGGKSILTTHLLNAAKSSGLTHSFLSMGEPESILPGSELDIVLFLLYSYCYGHKVVAIDSLREVLLDVAGDLRKGGVSKGIPKLFTSIQRISVILGLHTIMVVNPSDVAELVAISATGGQSDESARVAFRQIVSDMKSSLTLSTIIKASYPVEMGNVIPMTVDTSFRYGNRDFIPAHLKIPLLSDKEVSDLRDGAFSIDDNGEFFISESLVSAMLTARVD